jgi:hypothetical protein
MKKLLVLVSALAFSMMFVFSSTVFATLIPGATITYPIEANSPPMWYINTVSLFSGKDVIKNSIIVSYEYEGTHYIEPKAVILKEDQVWLVFNPTDFPAEADSTFATGNLINGDTFEATGPAMAWSRR